MSITHHPLTPHDRQAMAELRAMLASHPPMKLLPPSRPGFDDFMLAIPRADDVMFEEARIGGVPGVWCRPTKADGGGVIVYLHGGAYVVGSANAYRHVGSQLACRTGAPVFVVDYALAPERPFPKAFDNARTVYAALSATGLPIALAGDSAGGGLALALLAASEAVHRPVAAAVISPMTDLNFAGETYASRAAVDPLLSLELLAEPANLYAMGARRGDPRMSPLFDIPDNLPPVLVHVGDDEVLLDDSLRYVASSNARGNDVEGHVWEGMTHVFTSSFATLEAGESAMEHLCGFLRRHLAHGEVNQAQARAR